MYFYNQHDNMSMPVSP